MSLPGHAGNYIDTSLQYQLGLLPTPSKSPHPPLVSKMDLPTLIMGMGGITAVWFSQTYFEEGSAKGKLQTQDYSVSLMANGYFDPKSPQAQTCRVVSLQVGCVNFMETFQGSVLQEVQRVHAVASHPCWDSSPDPASKSPGIFKGRVNSICQISACAMQMKWLCLLGLDGFVCLVLNWVSFI